MTKLPTAENFVLSEDKVQKLSEIIDEINSVVGKGYDNDVAVNAMLQIKDILMKSEKLKDFFSLLLGNDEIKKKVLGIFSEEIYKSLRESE